ncbi:P-loop containing nucleoside triphosphate hydrolase protein [Cenococcum geophilum]
MLFEYNASPAMGAAAIKMDDYTKNLLQWLGIRRKEDPGRPLIFICHSLGGLVVKEALVEATLDPTHKSIVEATCLLVFFATPHQGGNYATVGDVAARIVRAGLRKPSNDLVKSLESSSNEATRRFEQFRHLNEKFLVISFYEGKSYGTLGLFNLQVQRSWWSSVRTGYRDDCDGKTAQCSRTVLLITMIASHLERAPRNMHWCIPRPVNALFIGRTDVLERIERAITRKENDQKQRRFVITGIGGQGKSELCLRIADRMREVFWGVFWVDVSSESAAAAGFLRISNILGSSAEDIDDTRQLLSNAKDDWLLVLDNADDPDTDYERYFPSGTRGAILITSRIPECSYYNTVGSEQLGGLNPGNCLTLLLRAAEIPAESWIEHKQAANRAIDVLGSHTLALIQAGAYIAQGYCSMEEYPVQYQQQCERLLKFSLNQAQSRYLHVYATFEASAQVLESSSKETNRDALELLHLLATLHYNNLPFELFKDAWTGAQYARDILAKTTSIDELSKWHVSQLPQFVQVDLDKWDPYRLHRAQNLLQSLALVTKGKESGSPTVSMHPLIHTWTNIRQNQVRKRQSWRATGCTLALSYYGNSEWRPYRTHLKLHLQSFLNSDSQERDTESPTMEMIRTLFQCGRLLHKLRIDSTLQDLLERLFDELKGDPLKPVEEFLPLYRLASKNLHNMGKIKRTVEVLEKIGRVEDATLAKDHPDRLASQHELAGAYEANGQIKDAVQLLEHVVKVEEITLAKDHPDRLASQHALAQAYEANGQIKDAVQLLEHVVKVRETTLAKDHPDRLASQHELAGAYNANGQIKDALTLPLGAPNNELNVRQTKSRFHRGLRKGLRGLFQRSRYN